MHIKDYKVRHVPKGSKGSRGFRGFRGSKECKECKGSRGSKGCEPDAGKAEPQEPILNLSPFSEDGSIRADDSWLNGGLRSSKKKKDKRMSWSDD